MAVQASAAVRNARAQSVETAIGATAVLKIRTGAQPATVATADSGTVLATLTLPADWLSCTAGVASLLGTWQDLSADAAGVAGHFRVYASDGTTAHLQGSVGQGTGDMQLNNTNIALGQPVTISEFGWTEPNA